MKPLYILLLLSLFSCGEKNQKAQTKAEEHNQVLVEEIIAPAEAQDAMDAVATEASENSNFEAVLASILLRPFPIKETTNFDDFIEAEDYKDLDTDALLLYTLYSDFSREKPDFKAIKAYRLALSEEFYTVVATIAKGDNEMESVLINYNLDGGIIDSKVVSYDEIAEGQSQIHSKITKDRITIDNIFWGEEKQVATSNFKIEENGKIRPLILKDQEKNELIIKVLKQLNLELSNIKTDLVVSKVQPNNPNETILVIPELSEEYDEYHFDMNSHIVLVDNSTQKITHRYFESAKTNGWTSDAIALSAIKIDTAPYFIAENVRAFGIRVRYNGSSRVNPYTNETLSLFVKENDMLKKVLHNFDVINAGGEFDGSCHGEFMESKKVLSISGDKTLGYFNITVTNTIIETEDREDKNGKCQSKETRTTERSVLIFKGQRYEEFIKDM